MKTNQPIQSCIKPPFWRGLARLLLSINCLVLTVFTACSGDDGTDIGNAPVAVQFASSVDNVAKQRTFTAAGGTEWVQGDKVGIFMLKENATLASGNIVGGADNKPYEAQTGNNATSSFIPVGGTPIYYPTNGNKVDFVAYYPYTTPLTNYKLAVDVSNQTNPAQIDVLYSNTAKGYHKNSSAAVDLQFSHALSKISFTLKAGIGAPNLTNAKIEISNVNTTANVDLADGSVENLGLEGTITAHTNATAIVPPQSTSTSKLTVTLADDVNKFECDFSNKAFEQGKDHGYNITVDRTGITVSAGNITVWTGKDDALTEGDTAIRYKVGDYYPDPDVVYEGGTVTSGRAATGIVYWLDSPVNGKSKKGKIVSLDEETNNKKWADAKDWCAAKGTSWSLPTKEELKALYAGYSGLRYEYISGWDDYIAMPGNSDQAYQDARTAFNGKLTAAAGGKKLENAWYWSSSEVDYYGAWVVGFSGGLTSTGSKGYNGRVRAVSAF